MNRRSVSPRIEVAGQPTRDELQSLRAEGFVGVVNVRLDGEPEQPLSPGDEAIEVGAAGLDYLHVPVGGGPIDPSGMDAIYQFLEVHSAGKVLIHCKQGGRAQAVALLYLARRENWPVEEVIVRGLQEGFALSPGLQILVREYLRGLSH